MPQSLNQKAVNNFVRGLITEAGELTFPDGASVDELNCDLRRDGTRRRRLAVSYEDSYVLESAFRTVSDSSFVTTGNWTNVGGNADLEFLVVQVASRLYFYNKGDLPYSGQMETNYIDLTTYEQSGSSGSETAKCQFTSIKGNLVVSSPEINTIAIEYSLGVFSVSQISFEIRDFEWQGDTTQYYNNESTPSQNRKYDAQNTGWNTGNGAPTDLTKRLTHPWYAGKNDTGDYDSDEWEKIYGGTTLTGNGHYVLDFFTKNRQSASGITGLTKPTDPETSRFRCVESFSGRVFYAGVDSSENAGTILFSKLVETVDDLGICHQQNDPTAEYSSDLLDTDGGEIKIPDAVKIQKLYAYQNSLFIFAENGIWQITGVDGVFRASSYSVNRVSRIGLLQPETFVEAEGVPFWWSRFGIHTLQTDSVSGQGQEQNLTLSTIQSFWDSIDSDVKLKVTSVYDGINKRIYWAYPNEGETVESKLNNFLILDVPLQAFYPWKVSDQEGSNTNCIVGLAFYSGFGAKELELDVTSNSGADDVVLSTGDDVISTQVSNFTTGDPAIILLCRDGDSNRLTMGGFIDTGFLDWGDANYSSYAETGYDFVGDLITKKSAPYIATYCRLTEEGFTGTEEDGYEAIRPSSLFVSSAWDFNDTFGASQQAYRLKFPVVVDPSNLDVFDYPESVITSRLKVRGTGRSVRIRYESEEGKDFLLLGWGVIYGRNPRF
jgi:hypothetical protein